VRRTDADHARDALEHLAMIDRAEFVEALRRLATRAR